MLARLFELLFPTRADEKRVRDCSPDDFLALLAPEIVGGGGLIVTALLPFPDDSVRAAIHEAKYHGNEKAFMLLASALAEYLHELVSENVGFTKPNIVLVPVPLGKERRRERGFNQVEEVTRRALRSFSEVGTTDVKIITSPNLLVRTRETTSQVSLPRRERLSNMRGAFQCPTRLEERSGAEHTYIVCDDVVTTGATLASACSALKSAGAQNVLAIAWAH